MSFISHTRAIGPVVCAIILGLGCGSEPKPPTPKPSLQPPASKPRAPRRVRPSNLNSALNLKASGERRLGFALPMGARKAEHEQSRYIVTTPRRLRRFYDSRKHLVRKRLDGWEVTHTELSLADMKNVVPTWRHARLYIRPGPGPGYTLRFDPGVKSRRPDLPLLSLIRREQRSSQVVRDRNAKPKLGKKLAASKRSQAKVERHVPPPRTANRRRAPEKLKRFSLSRLRRSALRNRGRAGRTLDVSKRVYKWSKKGRRVFQD